jgi:hypothetical protein
MEVTTHEPSTPDADSTASRPRICEPETPDREAILKKIVARRHAHRARLTARVGTTAGGCSADEHPEKF